VRRVALAFDKSRTGTVVEEGPEVSEVQLDDGGLRYFTNTILTEEEKTMSEEKTYDQMTGPELVTRYNQMAAARNLAPVKKFRDIKTAIRRCQDIETTAKPNGPVPAEKPDLTQRRVVVVRPAAKETVTLDDETDAVRRAFGFNVGSSREKLLLTLLACLGQQVSAEDLQKAVFGSRSEANAKQLESVARGLPWAIGGKDGKKPKLPYEYKREKNDDGSVTHGLHSS